MSNKPTIFNHCYFFFNDIDRQAKTSAIEKVLSCTSKIYIASEFIAHWELYKSGLVHKFLRHNDFKSCFPLLILPDYEW